MNKLRKKNSLDAPSKVCVSYFSPLPFHRPAGEKRQHKPDLKNNEQASKQKRELIDNIKCILTLGVLLKPGSYFSLPWEIDRSKSLAMCMLLCKIPSRLLQQVERASLYLIKIRSNSILFYLFIWSVSKCPKGVVSNKCTLCRDYCYVSFFPLKIPLFFWLFSW